jgi:CheY-like chemotaxis protein
MNRYIKNYQLHLLVAEDIEVSRIECVDLLRTEFTNAEIDQAASIEDGSRLIKETKTPYDCAILDLKLPLNGMYVATTQLAEEILDRFGPTRTRLIQWTGYPEEPAIATFRKHNRIPQSGIVYEVLSKSDLLWPDKMVDFVTRIVAEQAIGQWLDDPYFARLREGRQTAVVAKGAEEVAPVNLPAFLDALLDVWPLLEPYRKGQALKTFQGTDWEIGLLSGAAQLTNARAAQAIADAKESQKLFEQLLRPRS